MVTERPPEEDVDQLLASVQGRNLAGVRSSHCDGSVATLTVWDGGSGGAKRGFEQMVMHGANADELEALAARMQAGAQMLERAAKSITSQLQASPWEGRRAQAFRAEWSRDHRVSLLRTAAEVSQAAQTLRRNAAQQREASGPGGASARMAQAVVRRSGPTAAEIAAFGPRVDLRQTRVYELSGSGAELGGTYGTEVVKEYLSDGRVRVTVRNVVLGGVEDAGFMASGSWGEHTRGVGGTADVGAGVVGGSSMIFANDAAAERQIQWGLAARAASLAGPLALPFATGEMIHGIAAGDDIRSSGGIAGRAGAAALGMADQFFGQSASVGSEGSRELVIDWSGAAGVRGTTTVTGESAAVFLGVDLDAKGSATVEYEAIAGADGQAELVLRGEVFDGGRRFVSESRVDIDRSLVPLLHSGGDLSKVLADGVQVETRISEYEATAPSNGTYGIDAIVASGKFTTSSVDERLVSTSMSSAVYRRN